ncbi:PilZ domain-containing protein [Paenibacillus faecis]|uniref:PilZ domain-containing protein n=2 Tax=Paenibacillus TaxID=44249 RepID=A0A5D0CQG9_9BACL|nr:PilZ domain-containing protein [Paenibacillus faecis]
MSFVTIFRYNRNYFAVQEVFMINRRTEPFRYSFNPPLDAWIEIVEINGSPLPTKPAPIELVDISKSGCRIRTALNLRAFSHNIRLLLHVRLNENSYAFTGEIRWQKELEPQIIHYGICLHLSDEEKEKLNVELRGMAAARRIVVK